MSDRISSFTNTDACPNNSLTVPLESMQFTGASAPGNDTTHSAPGLPSLQISNESSHDASTIATTGNAASGADISGSLGTMNPAHLGSAEASAATTGVREDSQVAHGDNLGLNNAGDLMAGGLIFRDLANTARVPMAGVLGTGIAGFGLYNQWRHHSPSTPADNMMIGGNLAACLGSAVRAAGYISPVLGKVGTAAVVAGTILEGVGLAQRIGELEHHDKDK